MIEDYKGKGNMEIKKRYRDKLYVSLFFKMFKTYHKTMDCPLAFSKAIVDSSHAKIGNKVAVERIIKLWEKRAESYHQMYKGKKKSNGVNCNENN